VQTTGTVLRQMADQAYDSAAYWETAQTNDTGFHSVTAGRDQRQVIVATVSGVKLFLSVICINWISVSNVRLPLTCVFYTSVEGLLHQLQ